METPRSIVCLTMSTTRKRRPRSDYSPAWRADLIAADMRSQALTVAELADRASLSPTSVYRAIEPIHGVRTRKATVQAIAKALRKPWRRYLAASSEAAA